MFLDVRTKTEFRRGHVPGAVHVPFWKVMFLGAGDAASPGDDVVVYCSHGGRAWMAKMSLRLRGYRRVSLLPGQMRGWRRAGKPVE